MIWRIEGSFLIKLNVFVQIFSADQRKAEMRNVFIQREGQILSHFPQDPIEYKPHSQRVSDNLIRVLIVFDEVNESFLLFALRLGIH